MNLVRDKDILLGIRPEHVSLGEGPAGAVRRHGTVTSVEYMGADTIVSLASDDSRIAIRLPGASTIHVGDQLTAHWASSAQSRFDAAGMRIN